MHRLNVITTYILSLQKFTHVDFLIIDVYRIVVKK